MKPTRVLVVDDSATMRGLISAVLRRDPDIDVVGQAADPLQAREAIKALNPDVVTLDVEMPNMSGLEFLEKIMRLRPTPVIMVSNLTSHGTTETIKALEIGAFDCIAKPQPGDAQPFADLAEKVKAAGSARVRTPTIQSQRPAAAITNTAARAGYKSDGRIVAIGASTGGVEALITVISHLPENCPPVVITQHMPATFTKSFAARLDRLSSPKVSEAEDGAPLVAGRVYLAPGGVAHLEVARAGTLRCRLRSGDAVSGHRPSVDVLFHSVAKTMGANALGVILTGMGRDGAEGLLAMRQAGARTIGQDESSSLVYGMPKAAFEVGAVEKQVPLHRISLEILGATSSIKEGAL